MFIVYAIVYSAVREDVQYVMCATHFNFIEVILRHICML
jgi:hypothetical protein